VSSKIVVEFFKAKLAYNGVTITTKPGETLVSRPAVRRRLAYEENTIKSCEKETANKNQAGASRSRSSQGRRAE